MTPKFSLSAKFLPSGDQPQAIAQLIKGLDEGRTHQTLKGVTGSGKTFTMANVIATSQRPTIILAHNKTLAAQLYGEMKAFFPENAVEYFVSYYDYYQPEAYIPSTDTFIEKDASVNSHIERMRLSTTKALIERRDVIVVASVSSVYGLGTPETYRAMQIPLQIGKPLEQRSFLHRLAELQYTRCGKTIERATFRVRGEVIDVFPADSERDAIRIELFDNEIEHLSCIDPITGVVIEKVEHYLISPKTLYATPRETIEKAAGLIRKEVKKQHKYFIDHNQLIEANRILERTRLDTEMMLELGYCSGIENYSRYLSDHKPNQPPSTLLDYLPRDGLLFVDESHVMIPQISAMFSGDKKRKEVLVQYGFRLPSALDNRPLMFSEFEAIKPQTIFVSATPGEYELERSLGVAVEQLIRPTGLLDPIIEVHPAHNQIEHLLPEIQKCIKKDERVLITTLTKKMAEELAEKLDNIGVPVRYIHGDIVTAERVNIIRDLRLGVFDVLIGVNLLREGLDIPEVSLVVILNADARGFLRTERALTQTIGRAARNINGKAILYGDVITEAMQRAIDETEYRRTKQAEYNQKHGIVVKPISRDISIESFTDKPVKPSSLDSNANSDPLADLTIEITKLEKRMTAAAENLDFEGAALIRDQISELYQQFIS